MGVSPHTRKAVRKIKSGMSWYLFMSCKKEPSCSRSGTTMNDKPTKRRIKKNCSPDNGIPGTFDQVNLAGNPNFVEAMNMPMPIRIIAKSIIGR
jgi:hypothetical protein